MYSTYEVKNIELSAFSVFIAPRLFHSAYNTLFDQLESGNFLLFPSCERGNHITVVFLSGRTKAIHSMQFFDETFLRNQSHDTGLQYTSTIRDYFNPFTSNSIRATCNYDRILISSLQRKHPSNPIFLYSIS